jgi:hypothetical protein
MCKINRKKWCREGDLNPCITKNQHLKLTPLTWLGYLCVSEIFQNTYDEKLFHSKEYETKGTKKYKICFPLLDIRT